MSGILPSLEDGYDKYHPLFGRGSDELMVMTSADGILGYISAGLGYPIKGGNMLIITMPAIIWILNMDFISVLIIDMGMVIFFMLFAIIFNWCYDLTKYQIISP